MPAALQPITVNASAPDPAPILDRYEGRQFSISYPQGWRIETRPGEESGSSATMLTPSADGVLVRISVSPRAASAQSLAATRALAATSKPGYRDLGLGVVTVAGQPGVRWDYLVREGGIELRRTEVVFTDARGNGYAIVTQAPTASFARWRNALDDVRESIVPTAR